MSSESEYVVAKILHYFPRANGRSHYHSRCPKCHAFNIIYAWRGEKKCQRCGRVNYIKKIPSQKP